MKKLALIVLILVLSLSGCASSGKRSSTIVWAWNDFWREPGEGSWELVKGECVYFWHHPGEGSLELVKWSWKQFWADPWN